MQITIGRWPLAMGLDWQLPKNSQEISEGKKSRKEAMFVVAKQAHMSWLGFHSKTGPGVFVAALLVGLVEPNAVVLHSLNDGNAWVCMLRDGMPIVGRDLVLPAEEATKKAREWSGRSDSYTMIGVHLGAVTTIEKVIGALENQIAANTISKGQTKSTVLKSTGFAVSSAYLVTGAASVVLLAGYAFTQLHTPAPAEDTNAPERAARAQAAASRNASEIAHASEVNKGVLAKQVAEVAATYSARVSPVQFWNAASQIRAVVPVSLYGYQPSTYNCTPAGCAVIWRGEGRFVRLSDKQYLPNVESNFSSEKSATSNFSIVGRPSSMPTMTAGSPEEFQMLVRSEMLLHYPQVQIGELKDVIVSPPPATGLKPVVVTRAGTWQIQLTGPTALATGTDLMQLLERLPMKVATIMYDKQSMRLDVAGEYSMSPVSN
ncbi:hypothetical protein LPN04_31380 [Rugamonas sp. A1-17]|nr:hypothetical protein [Rugamonas sp. A1-17]